MDGSVVVIGGSAGLGKAIASHYADAGHDVVVTSRDKARAEATAQEIGGSSRGIAVDLTRPAEIRSALAEIGPVRYLVIAAIERDENTVADFDVAGATSLTTLKLVGYPEVIHSLRDRLTEDASVVLFGGLAKDRPYPGSTMVTTVNGGITTLINTLSVELAPIRFNAIHPGIVGDTPYWAAKPPEVLEGVRSRTPTGRLVTTADIVDAVRFLLENPGVNAVNLRVDGGTLLG
ncbi:MAG TPA: SDR family oxidoreductase [Acidimicrobiia bacterium]|jgi:NAD(P)-dependent dehydrogenase (short-subunit alcohol dehydrogenase family)|nr:SDR family oxidoreductase [Acidimicrobiia bacterium]